VPVAVTVLGSEQLRTLAVDSLQDLRAVTPGISVGEVSGGVGGTVSLRGVGTTAGSNPTFEQTVAVNIDGVQLSRGGAVRVGQIDMEKIEVLRGPQALFFGKNSPAGVISITTADPGRSFEVEARAPGGLLSTVNGWVVPRVIVAQAGRLRLNPASVRACTAKRA